MSKESVMWIVLVLFRGEVILYASQLSPKEPLWSTKYSIKTIWAAKTMVTIAYYNLDTMLTH